jgi:sulfite reductase alpha subunit-like flavoprotein
MVCGGSAMAEGVRAEFEVILERLGTDVAALKRQRRYLEDIY